MRVLITGAAGNLGSRISRHLAKKHDLRLLIHKSVLPADLVGLPNVSACRGDLAEVSSLYSACAAVDCVIHLAGVLFAPNPESFLPHTNLEYVQNLIKAAKLGGVRKFILVSFPHVEGETTPEHPATDRLDATSQVVHFRTRLEAEKIVLGAAENFVPVILRSGVVYGKGIKLIEAARWLLRYRMLAVWRRPTWIHLIALPDFLAVTEAAVEKDYVRGIYNICDDAPITVQDFLDRLAFHFKSARPWRLPRFTFFVAATVCEAFASLFRTASPLTRDIIRAAMTSSVADNRRTKQELLPRLAYPTLEEGLALL